MMIPNRRKFERFDIITVLEFKLLTKDGGVFMGITNNFSFEGFCLETQCVAFEPGDPLELRLRHPHSDLTISVPAHVVWKKTADKFATLLGIELKEPELDTRLRMLEIMSAAGDVPVDSFLSAGSDEGTAHEERVAPAHEIARLTTEKGAPEPAEMHDKNTESGESRDEELVSREMDVTPGEKSGEPFYEVFKAAQTEGREAEDLVNEEAEKSDMPWPKDNAPEGDPDQASDGTPNLLTLLLRNRTFIYSSITAVIIGISVYALFSIFQRPDNDTKSPAPVPAQSAFPQEEARSQVVPQLQDLGINRPVAPLIPPPDKQHLSTAAPSPAKKREVRAVPPKSPDTRTAVEQKQYIQVGAWTNPDNARDMLQRVKKYYPNAYMTAGRKFNRVKIPARNQAQVNSIIKDIEGKFHIKPLVTSVR
ncbi:MAG TPA: hypothetical protein DDX85_12630 [Nitrospiraceae bacterium]|nr:hypothetical protein [Nitrospiraceae bacterium]